MSHRAYLAFDLGAESGRSILGLLRDGRLELQDVNRFANGHVNLPSGLHWNLTNLFSNMVEGLAAASKRCAQDSHDLVSLGVDTWGVDFGLLGKSGELLTLPHIYRDPHTHATYDRAINTIGKQRIYEATGIEFIPINTLYQLMALNASEPNVLQQARKLLFVPDLMHYFFTGEAVVESSIASTSQMVDPRTGNWAMDLLHDLQVPTHILAPISPSGSQVGTVRESLARDIRIDDGVQVVAPASHDTASAIVAIPAEADSSWCYLSCGTWSLFGAELNEPVLTETAREAPFTNEGGYGGTIRFLQNIIGLWMVQECRRDFERRDERFDYETLTQLAKQATPFKTLVETKHAPFSLPGEMLEKITAYATQTNQPVPASVGGFVRCCLESLALSYRRAITLLESVLDRKFEVLHLVGGGGKNQTLCQMTANAIGRPVVVGPYEATAMGNVLVQAMTAGDVADLNEAREIVKASVEPRVYEPQDVAAWTEAYERFEKLPA